jgi:hypothetical protein
MKTKKPIQYMEKQTSKNVDQEVDHSPSKKNSSPDLALENSQENEKTKPSKANEIYIETLPPETRLT